MDKGMHYLCIETSFRTFSWIAERFTVGHEPGLLRTGQSSQESGNLTLYLEVIAPENCAAL